MIIRIVSTPPGLEEESIRKDWVGVELSVVSDEEAAEAIEDMPTDSPSVGGYMVSGYEAIAALQTMERFTAADFYSQPVPPEYMRFAKACCEVIE